MDMAISVAHGSPFLGHYPTKSGNVLLIEEEGQAFDLAQRGDILGARMNSDILTYHCRGFRVDSDEWIKDLVTNILPVDDIALIVIDPLHNVHAGDENNAKDMKILQNFYKKVRLCSPLTSISFGHHVNKPAFGAKQGSLKHMRGSSAISGDAEVILETIKRESPDPKLLRFDLHMPKRKAFAGMGNSLSLELDLRNVIYDEKGQVHSADSVTWKVAEAPQRRENEDEDGGEEIQGKPDPVLLSRAKILQMAPTGEFTSANDALEKLGGKRTAFLAAWRQLVEEGLLRKNGKHFLADQGQNGQVG